MTNGFCWLLKVVCLALSPSLQHIDSLSVYRVVYVTQYRGDGSSATNKRRTDICILQARGRSKSVRTNFTKQTMLINENFQHETLHFSNEK